MNVKSLVLAALCSVSMPGFAALDLKFVDGADIGIDPVLVAHAEACGDKDTWLWGATGWHDPAGSFLYFTFHGTCGRSFLFKGTGDGTYTDITPPNADGTFTGTSSLNQISSIGLPTENRPIIADLNNDGYMDVISTGDETSSTSGSMISTGPGVWDINQRYRLFWSKRSKILDVDDDGYLDIQAASSSNKQENWGKGFVRTARNLAGEGFQITTTPLELPADAPAEVVERVNAANDRFHFTRLFPVSNGYIVSYGGAYRGSKWHYFVRDGEVFDRGLPGVGTALEPLEMDGSYAVPVQYGSKPGFYRQNADGMFYLDEQGDMPLVNESLKGGAYLDEFWSLDLDEDGDNDLVMSNLRNGFGYVLENDNGVFRLHKRIEHVDGQAMSVADLDGDGDFDLVVAGRGDRKGPKRDGRDGTLYINQLRQPGDPIPPAEPEPTQEPITAQDDDDQPVVDQAPEPQPEPEALDTLNASLEQLINARPGSSTLYSSQSAIDALREMINNARDSFRSDSPEPNEVPMAADQPSPSPDPADPTPVEADPVNPNPVDPEPVDEQPAPAPVDPSPVNPPVSVGNIPLPDHDPQSTAWSRWISGVGQSGGRANEHALISVVTGDTSHCVTAINKAQSIVDANTVAGNQYLAAGRQFSSVFETLAWCDVPEAQASEWAAWGRGHLGETDGSTGSRSNKIWWSNRWSRNNPANNYYHSFIVATTVYAMATGDDEWLNWLRDDRLPRMQNYYSRSPEGGSREGTGYGESHREVFRIAKMWRDYDGTEVLPQDFIDNSIRYWVNAIAPGHRRLATIGDQTRAKGKIDGYHCDILDNALQIAEDPDAIALGRWQISQLSCFGSAVFRRLILRDYPEAPRPENIPLTYFAAGAGVLFTRDSWDADATFLYFTAGRRDEAHQCEDQGAFSVWAEGRWQTTGDHVWSRNGLCFGDVSSQNVVRFPGVDRNIRGKSGTLEWSVDRGKLAVDMDLSEVVGKPWLRTVEWVQGSRSLQIMDTFSSDDAEFGFEVPSEDDARAPYVSDAQVDVERLPSGFNSVVTW